MPTWIDRYGPDFSLFTTQIKTRGDGAIFSASLDVMGSTKHCFAWGEAQGSGMAEQTYCGMAGRVCIGARTTCCHSAKGNGR